MQKTNSQAKTVRRQMQNSTTLSRKYVRKPQKSAAVIVKHNMESAATGSMQSMRKRVDGMQPVSRQGKTIQPTAKKVDSMQNMQTIDNQSSNPQFIHRQTNDMQSMDRQSTNMKTMNNAKQTENNHLTAKELKDQAIRKALENASNSFDKPKKKKDKKKAMRFGFGKIMLAVSCATAAVAAIVYFVNMNMPDISLQVAALQTGIDASYPSYVPRDFSVSSITSEEGKITMEFSNSSTGDAFTLVEEASSWDSSALESNYMKKEFNDKYTIVREQGLTIYISGNNAAWVNGGVVFKLTTTSGSLTDKQIKSIAVSM